MYTHDSRTLSWDLTKNNPLPVDRRSPLSGRPDTEVPPPPSSSPPSLSFDDDFRRLELDSVVYPVSRLYDRPLQTQSEDHLEGLTLSHLVDTVRLTRRTGEPGEPVTTTPCSPHLESHTTRRISGSISGPTLSRNSS